MIEDLARGLLTEYWSEHSYAGGRGKGQVMTNHCGIAFCKYDYEGGHEARSKAMAWYLQGLEAAYVHALTILSEEYDYEVMANEHDGLITIGTIPDEAQRRARELSGSRNAKLADKRFEGEEEVREVASLGWEMPSPPLEEKSSEATDSKATASEATASEATASEATATGPGESEPPTRPETTSGSKETTSREASSQKAGSETGSGGVPDAAGGPGASISENGDQTASSATEQPDSEQRSNWREEESEETLDYLLPDREISHREVSDKELEEILGGADETSDEWAYH